MQWSQPFQPYNTDHNTDHIMDHRTDHSTDDSAEDIADRGDSADSRGRLYHPSRWSSDSELDRRWGYKGDGGGRLALHQYYSQFYRENRSASCPPAPEHRDLSPLCHPETATRTGGHRPSTTERLLTAPLGVLEANAARPEDQWDNSRCSTPGSVGMSDTVEPWVHIQHPWDHIPNVSGGATGQAGYLGGTTILGPNQGPLQERAGEKGCEPPKPLAKHSLPPQEHTSTSHRPKECLTSNPHNENQESKTKLTKPQIHWDKGEKQEHLLCGGPAGIKAPPPSTSQPVNSRQGQRSPTNTPSGSCNNPAPASATPALPVHRSPAIREAALPGRAHRWRWTPEHKLQPEFEPEGRRVKPYHSSGSEESDIPPFAERMRFFEETSRSRSVSHLPGLMCRAQKPKVHPSNHRRYSYQDPELCCTPEALAQTVSPRERGEPSNPEQNCSSRAQGPEDPKMGLSVDVQCSSSLCDSSTFRPITVPGHQDCSQQQQDSNTPTEVQLRGENEQTQPNGKFSPTQSDCCCTGDLQTAEGALTQGCQSPRDASEVLERLSECSGEVGARQSQKQVAAISENENGVCEQLQQLDPGATLLQVAMQGEMGESSERPKRKKDPPPRPPPPNWAQFHGRRASCHNLLSSPPSPPPSPTRPGSPLHPLPCPEVTRQRSHSCPLRDGGESRLLGPDLPPGPALSPGPPLTQNPALPASSALMHRAFRPVVPPVEQSLPLRHPDPLRLTDMPVLAEPHPRFYALQGRPFNGDDRRDALERQVEARKERRPAFDAQHRLEVSVYSVQRSSGVPAYGPQHSSGVPTYSPQHSLGVPAYSPQHSLGVPIGENGSVLKDHLPEPYFTLTCERHGPQSRTFSRNPKLRSTPTHNTVRGGEDTPLETDIDQFLEEQKVRCSSRPTAVLETDLDSLPEMLALPPATWRAHGGSLVDLLLEGGPGARTRTDLMGELLPQGGERREGRETWRGGGGVLGLGPDALQSSAWGFYASQGPGSSHSSYYSTSSAEDQLLSQAQELPGRKEEGDDELSYKKQQVMECVRRRLGVLREAQRGLQEDVRANARLGEEVEALVRAVCRPSEADRFRTVIGDLEKVVSLLLSLSSRLLRVETTLEDLSAENHHERFRLLEKKQQLLAQLTEAQELKEHVDGRQQAVCRVLAGCLTPEQLRDYSHFLRMKAALLVEQRQLEDRIRLHEEQLRALRESLPPSNGSPAGLEYSYY
ncbi:protein Shroom2-like [Anguilla rostrata]|uniref:protein Shroom2-like n=1 Tax=Anguilla rostrata TaxID=7938 RepID=UPI0030D4A4BD